MRWTHAVVTFGLIALAPLLAACEEDEAEVEGATIEDVLTPVPETIDDWGKQEEPDFADPEPAPELEE